MCISKWISLLHCLHAVSLTVPLTVLLLEMLLLSFSPIPRFDQLPVPTSLSWLEPHARKEAMCFFQSCWLIQSQSWPTKQRSVTSIDILASRSQDTNVRPIFLAFSGLLPCRRMDSTFFRWCCRVLPAQLAQPPLMCRCPQKQHSIPDPENPTNNTHLD